MNTFANTQASAPIDLEISETFHRLKRTALLLSSSLIILALAKSNPDHNITLIATDAKLNTDLLRSLIWLSALYYMIGFVFEARVVIHANSEAMLGTGVKTMDRAMSKIASTIASHVDDLEYAATAAREEAQRLRQLGSEQNTDALAESLLTIKTAAKILAERFPDRDHRDNRLHISDATHRLTEASNRISALSEGGLGAHHAINEAVNRHNEATNALRSHLEKLHKDMNRLSRRIYGDRRRSFWAWEVGGASVSFLAATLWTIPALGRTGGVVIAYLLSMFHP